MNKLNKLILIALLSTGITAYAQVTDAEDDLITQSDESFEGWKKGGMVNINFSQVSLKNWAAGGQNSISINSMLSLYANYKKDNDSWENYLDLGYGIVRQGDEGFIKSDDRIDFTSKYGRKAAENLYYAALFNFRSQFTPGYNYPDTDHKISDFLAPAYAIAALGMDYKSDDDKLSLFVAPLTTKITYVGDKLLAAKGAFGVDKGNIETYYVVVDGDSITKERVIEDGKNIRAELGGYVRMMYQTDITKDISFKTNLDLFSNYLHNPKNIDVHWDNLLSLKVNNYISASISTSLIYDDDIDISVMKSNGEPKLNSEGIQIEGPRTQFKYVIAVGFQYKFGAEK